MKYAVTILMLVFLVGCSSTPTVTERDFEIKVSSLEADIEKVSPRRTDDNIRDIAKSEAIEVQKDIGNIAIERLDTNFSERNTIIQDDINQLKQRIDAIPPGMTELRNELTNSLAALEAEIKQLSPRRTDENIRDIANSEAVSVQQGIGAEYYAVALEQSDKLFSERTAKLEADIDELNSKIDAKFSQIDKTLASLSSDVASLASSQGVQVTEKLITAEEVFSDMFENAVRVDRFSRDDLKSCTAYSAYDLEETDEITVEVVFARVEDELQDGAPQSIRFFYREGGTAEFPNMNSREIQFSRQIDNPWNKSSSLPTLVYRGKLDIGPAMHQYPPQGSYPNRIVPGLAMVTFPQGEIKVESFIRNTEERASWVVGQGIPQNYLSDECKRKNPTGIVKSHQLYIDNIVPDTFFVAWYVRKAAP